MESLIKLPENVNWLIIKVCRFEKIEFTDIFIKTRRREIVESRNIVMVILSRHTKIPYSVIAGYFKMDHSSVNSAKTQYEKLYDTDKKYRDFVENLELKYINNFGTINNHFRHDLLMLDVINHKEPDKRLNISVARALVCH